MARFLSPNFQQLVRYHQWPAKILAAVAIAAATVGLPREAPAHGGYADTNQNTSFFSAAGRQNGQIVLRWWNTGGTATAHKVNWCEAKTGLFIENLWQPGHRGSYELSVGAGGRCGKAPEHNGLGVDIATVKTAKTGWTVSGLSPGRYVLVVTSAVNGHDHSMQFVTTLGTNRAGGYGGSNDSRRNQSRSFQENPAPNTTIGEHVRAYRDPEGNTQYYTLAGTDASKFTIGLTDGIIRTRDIVYDYDKGQRTFHVTVQVADRKNHAGSADTRIDDTAAVAISLTNYTGREIPSALRIDTGPADKSIRISWSKYTQETNKPPFEKYEARIKEGDTFLPRGVIRDIDTTTYTYTGLTNGTRYAVWVEACNHEGCGGNPVGGGRAAVTPAAAGVAVNPTSLTVPESGNNVYTLVLANQPTAAVTFAITRADNADTDLTASPAQLIFTPSNWHTARAVTVSAAADNDDARDGRAVFTHTATSGDNDYNGITVASVTATEADNDFLFDRQTVADQTYLHNGAAITPLTLPAATGGIGGTSYTLQPALPAGLSFDMDTRVLAGTPATVASITCTYTAADASGVTVNPVLSFAITVRLPQLGGTLAVAPGGGDRVMGEALTLSGATVPDNAGAASIAYDWWRSTNNGTLESSDLRVADDSPTYTVANADGGYWLFGRARVQAGGAFTPDAQAAVLTFRVYPPAGVGALTFVGAPRVGSGLHVVLSGGIARAGHNVVLEYHSSLSYDPAADIDTLPPLGWSEKPSAAVLAFPCCRGDASNNANPLNSGDVGRFIYSRLRYRGPNGLVTQPEDAPVAAISNARTLTDASPTVNPVSGRLVVGSTLIANAVGTTPLQHERAYQWYRHNSTSQTTGTAIDGANEMTYLLQETDINKHISVGVRYRLADGVQHQAAEAHSAISADAVVADNLKLRLRVFLEGPLR